MAYTSSHWGTYRLDNRGQPGPLPDDPAPSRVGRGWVSAARDIKSRILSPVVRRGWLDGDRGKGRGRDSFVEVEWDEASALVASELVRVREAYGNRAIFGGSYGWASAGRFHHAQSHLRRFLNLAGGYVASRETYSHAAAEVLWPYVVGLSIRSFLDETTSLRLVGENCEYLLAFGGISERTAQIASSGVSRHSVGQTLERLHERNVKIVNISPRGSDRPGAEWLAIRPGTDTALLLALSYEIVAAGNADERFLGTYTSGWPQWRDYLTGSNDGQARSAEWAAPICDIPADRIRALAESIVIHRTMISVAWSLQRADHGEQAIWAGLGLACVAGKIGVPGAGFAFGYGSTAHVGYPSRIIDWPSLPQGRNSIFDCIPVARIADMLLDPGLQYRYDGETRRYPDIKLVYWCGGNPFHHHQNLDRLVDAWQRPETVVVHDHCWTATARRADIVLPATTPLERADLMMNRRDPSLFYMSPVIERIAGARDDYEIFRGIAREMGLEGTFTEGRSTEEWLRYLWTDAQGVASDAGFALPDFESFREMGRFDIPDAEEDRIAFRAFVSDPVRRRLATETGRITLHNHAIEGLSAKGCPGSPTWMEPAESLVSCDEDQLHLISGQPSTRLHGQNDRGSEALADKVKGREPAYMHPRAAADRTLEEGDIIKLWNSRGACLAGLRLDPLIREDCIALATGAWFDPQVIDGESLEVHGNPNVLTIDRGCSELSQGNMAHTALVRVERWTGALPPLSIDRPPEIISLAAQRKEGKG